MDLDYSLQSKGKQTIVATIVILIDKKNLRFIQWEFQIVWFGAHICGHWWDDQLSLKIFYLCMLLCL